MRRGGQRQEGVALLIVLLLLVSVAGVAVATTALMTRAVASASAAQTRDQAVWSLLGAEQVALAFLGTGVDLPDETVPISTPLGTATARLRAVACVNVNAIVTGEEGAYETPRGETGELAGPGAARMTALVQALGGNAPAARVLLEAAADFMDADEVPSTGGAEDFDYARRDVPYRTSGRLLADPSELRAVAGWDVATYRALRPYLCALPTTNSVKLDVNGLRAADAPVLAAVLDNQVPMGEVERMIAGRPERGYEQASGFTAQPAIANVQPPPSGLSDLDVTPSLLELTATVRANGQALTMTALLFRDQSRWRVIEREFGA